MSIQLNSTEARVLGCLVEKELATPDYYPLTLNALVNACNQKSNRDPVMSLEEGEVQEAIDSLRFKQLAHRSAEGVRAAKYCHNLEGLLRLEPAEMALLAELLLRGPQTVGELRTRADRMTALADLATVEEYLQALLDRDEPLVTRLPRQPGRKEQRFAQTLTELPEPDADRTAATDAPSATGIDRIAALESEVGQLRSELDELQQSFKQFQAQFE